ncbi:MAG: IS3 family transposase [bacterium]|nr:IS3 family transposase [bacterium]
MKYAWIDEQAALHPVRRLCQVLDVSASGFYAWRCRAPSARTQENVVLIERMMQIHQECREAYGTERLWRELCGRGERCGRHRVARLRRQHGIVTKRRKRFLRSRNPYHRVPDAPRLVTWPFASPGPDRIWVVDITYIPTVQGWLYLAAVLDLHSRRVVGWSMATRMQQDLADAALAMAVARRRPKPGLIHHSDRGSQYTSKAYCAQLERIGAMASTSRAGMPYDNAVAESFFSTLKNELTHHERFLTLDQARSRVFDYIEVFYNQKRRHQSLGYRSPAEFEKMADVS